MPAKRLGFIEPMRAAVTSAPPYNGQWLYEVKFDGYRVLAVKHGKEVELWSRNEKLLNKRFPRIVAAVQKLPLKSCIVDGEVCALTDQGRSSFQLLQNSVSGNPPIVFYIFDILNNGSNDLRDLPLTKRKAILDKLMAKSEEPLRPSLCFTEDPQKVLEKMEMVGAEGSIAKLKNSPYESGQRSTSWVKIKFHNGQEFVVVGYTLPKNSRPYFGSLILGYYRGKELIFAGRVGTGFSDKTLRALYGILKPLEINKPRVKEIQEPSGQWRPKGWKVSESRWVKPKLVVQIQFTEWTEDGILRHPSFLGLRMDKKPCEVVRE